MSENVFDVRLSRDECIAKQHIIADALHDVSPENFAHAMLIWGMCWYAWANYGKVFRVQEDYQI